MGLGGLKGVFQEGTNEGQPIKRRKREASLTINRDGLMRERTAQPISVSLSPEITKKKEGKTKKYILDPSSFSAMNL